MTTREDDLRLLRSLCEKPSPGSVSVLRVEGETEFDLDGVVVEIEDEVAVTYLGKATLDVESSPPRWVCLANVSGALCRVEVKLSPGLLRPPSADDKLLFEEELSWLLAVPAAKLSVRQRDYAVGRRHELTSPLPERAERKKTA